MNRLLELAGRYALVAALAALVLAVSGCLFQGNQAEAARDAQARAEAIGTTAATQADLNAATGQIMDRTHRTEVVITTRAQEYADAAASAPGASASVPDDVARSWAAGIDGLRDEAARARSGAAPDRGGA